MAAELSPQDRRALHKLAQRIARVEKAQRRSQRTAQGPYRSLEGGSQEVYDDDGVLRGVIGEQADGTYTRVDLNAPAPPQPAEPIVDGRPGVLVVSSYGLPATDPPVWPLDFARLDVHVGVPGFTYSAASKVAEFTVDGGSVTLALDAGTYECLLVAVNTSGTESPESPRVSATVTEATLGAGGVKTYATDGEPLGLTPDDAGSLWMDTDNGNLLHRWDGFGWVPLLVGRDATAPDVIAGKVVPIDEAMSLEWGVPDPTDEPGLYSSLVKQPGDKLGNSQGATGLVRDGSTWVRIARISLQVTETAYEVEFRPLFTDAATGANTYGPRLEAPSGGATQARGFTRVGTRWYVLVDPRNFVDPPAVHVYEADWSFVGSWSVWSTGTEVVGLATDGTDLIVFRPATGALERRNPATGALVSSVTVTGLGTPPSGYAALAYGSFDLGSPRYAILEASSGFYVQKVWLVDAAGAAQPAETFDTPGSFEFSTFGTGLAWDAGAFAIGSSNGEVWSTVTNLTDREVWAAYTGYDSDPDGGTHETAPSPISAASVVVGKRCALEVWPGVMPLLDEAQVPDSIKVYTLIGAGPPASPADLHDSGFATPSTLTGGSLYVEPVDNLGGPPPTESTFPVGPSGALAAEVGGFVVRGDSTGAWPYLERQITDRADATYSRIGHDHVEYEFGPRVYALEQAQADLEAADAALADADTALDTRVDALEAADTALDARVAALEAGTAATQQLTPTMSGVSGHAFYIKKIAPGVVAVSGYVDVDDADGSRRDTGMRIPAGWEPPAQLIVSAPIVGGGDANYRYYFNTDGTIEFQQDGNTEGPFEGITALWFTA